NSLAEFETEAAASLHFNELIAGEPLRQQIDPFFVMDEDEEWTEQEVTGLYRITGSFEGTRYSGSVDVRLAGDTVVVVGYRSIGAALPNADVASAIMDHQLGCIDAAEMCAPFDLAAA